MCNRFHKFICCPQANGLFTCAYGKMITDVVLLGVVFVYVSEINLFYDDIYNTRTLFVITTLTTVAAIDAIFNMLFIMALHKDKDTLLKLIFMYAKGVVTLTTFLIVLFVNLSMYQLWYNNSTSDLPRLPTLVIGIIMVALQGTFVLSALARKKME